VTIRSARRIGPSTVCALLAAFGVSALGAQQKPVVTGIVSNAPGMVTVQWAHAGPVGVGFRVERKTPPGVFPTAPYQRLFTDLDLSPATVYEYRVCAGDFNAASVACSDWVSVRTQNPERPSTPRVPPVVRVSIEGMRDGEARVSWTANDPFDYYQLRYGPAGHPGQERQLAERIGPPRSRASQWTLRQLRPGTHYLVRVQGCMEPNVTHPFNSVCTDWRAVEFQAALEPPERPVIQIHAPQRGPRRITLRWTFRGVVEQVRGTRDGAVLFPARSPILTWTDERVRPNTEHTYRVCARNAAGEACSEPFRASGTPVPPSAPAGLTVTRVRLPTSRPSGEVVREVPQTGGETVFLRWSNAAGDRYVPGRYVVAERLVRGPDGSGPFAQIVESWVEVGRVDAARDPTVISIPMSRVLGAGNQYRVCAVVPGLGPSGRACSATAALR
jgi:hypothetical protein